MAESILSDESRLDSLGGNGRVVSYIRSVGTISGGCVAGVLGLTGLQGVVFYLVVSLSISAAIFIKTQYRPHRYFGKPWRTILLFGVIERNALLSYTLFWTMLYAFR